MLCALLLGLVVACPASLIGTPTTTQQSPAAAVVETRTDAHRGVEDKSAWIELLQCAVERSSDCLKKIKQTVNNERASEPLRQLAAILLEEWDLEPSNSQLIRARRVWMPFPTPDQARALLPEEFEYTVIVVSAVVQSDGTVEGVAVLRPSEYDALTERVAEAVSNGLYRPARDDKGYTSQRVEVVYRLEPRWTEGAS